MNIAWIRGEEKISFDRTASWFVLGVRGSGKSTFLETVAQQHLDRGHHILDLFGSRDGEGLGWLRNPKVDKDDVLLITGDNTLVHKAPADTKPVSELSLSDFEDYKVIISASPLYSSPDDEFRQVNSITALVYQRLSWRNLLCLLVRESANLYYSRLKIGDSQTQAKAQQVYLCREARHMGCSLALDTLKYTSVDSDIRATIDYLVFKAQGIMGLSRDLYWVYKFIEPNTIRRMKPNEFVILTRRGSLGLGVFPELSWHKKERENMLKTFDLELEYGQEINYADSKHLGDAEHEEFISDYLEERLSMNKIAKKRDVSSGTVYNHITYHNDQIKVKGICDRCSRVGGEYSDKIAERR